MGVFLVSFHAKTANRSLVQQALATGVERAWLGTAVGGWVSFYEEMAEAQDSNLIEEICNRVSGATGAPVIAFLVHDSDFVCYWLSERGCIRDQYNSCPEYFGDLSDMLAPRESMQEHIARFRGDIEMLLPLCPEGTDRAAVEDVLATAPGDYVFAEEQLERLASLLGIDSERAVIGYHDVGVTLQPEELELECVGAAVNRTSE